MEHLQEPEGGRGFRVDGGRWEPTSAEELKVVGKGSLAPAEVDAEFMDADRVEENEVVAPARHWVETSLTGFMSELDTEPERLEGHAQEVIGSPLLFNCVSTLNTCTERRALTRMRCTGCARWALTTHSVQYS